MDLTGGSGAAFGSVFSSAGGRLATASNTANTGGEQDHRTTRRTITVDFSNYMLYADAAPGIHAVWFRLEQYHGLRVQRVVISMSSAVEPTRDPPDRLSLHADSSMSATIRRPMTVSVVLSNPGSAPITNIRLTAIPSAGTRILNGGDWLRARPAHPSDSPPSIRTTPVSGTAMSVR